MDAKWDELGAVIGLAIGTAIGYAYGLIVGNIGLWMSLGTAVGLILSGTVTVKGKAK